MNKSTNKAEVIVNSQEAKPAASIFDLELVMNNGHKLPLKNYQGKKILLVNTASDCGYTPQYADLQQLYSVMKDELVVLGFPSNEFGEQEKGSDQEIASFCSVNYGVEFPIAQKSSVLPGGQQNPVYQWLTDPAKNGWNSQPPIWNFCKYLIDEDGTLKGYFGPAVSPLDEQLRKEI